MRLMILTHCYPPEFSGAATMTAEFARHMALQGHEVTVITHFPRHHMIDTKQRKLRKLEEVDGVKVIRVFCPDWQRSSFVLRFFQDLISEIKMVARGLQCKAPDAVFTYSPPITFAVIAWLIKLTKRSKLILSIQDTIPQAAISMGLITDNGVVAKSLGVLERSAYACADYIGVHSPRNRGHIIGRGVAKHKVGVVPLWVDTELLEPKNRDNHFAKKHELVEKFVVLYSGTVGFGMGIESIARTADILRDHKDIQFVVVGNGNRMADLKQQIADLQLDNFLFLPLQPRKEFPFVLASGDVLLVTLQREHSNNPNGYFRAVVPHKLLSSMACGRPILTFTEEQSDTADLVRISRCGWVVQAGDYSRLAEKIVDIKRNSSVVKEMGENGRAFVCRHFSTKRQVERVRGMVLGITKNEVRNINNPWAGN